MAKNLNKSVHSSSTVSTHDLSQMCRTCLKPRTKDTRPDMKFYNIFETHQESRELIGSLLIDCTDIDVSFEPSLAVTILLLNCFPLSS
jgi:hypothetical protein